MSAAGIHAQDHHIRLTNDPAQIDAEAWDSLLQVQPAPTPFLKLAYLRALHASNSAVPARGWSPRFLLIERQGRLVGACVLYLKTHSFGEYVFDWAWADAYQRHGMPYFPKLLGAVPFTPVPGTRLMAVNDHIRTVLAHAILEMVRQEGLSSAHLLFVEPADAAALTAAGYMLRDGVQFHWSQRPSQPWSSFDDFLGSMHREKRKKIQQERRRVQEAGVSFQALQAQDITEEDWDFFFRCYTLTYQSHGSSPYLTRDFFRHVAATMSAHWLLFVAQVSGERVGSSLIALDPQRRRAFGRYWGATRFVPCLHFEACYYQPLDWCIRNGYTDFEGGAQGAHKVARGLLPVRTQSAHWLADKRFASAVADFLIREGVGMQDYANELKEHTPFRTPAGMSLPD